MSLNTSVTGAVKTRPYEELEGDRYEYITLDQAEPNPGLPESDGALFFSNLNGTRGFTTEPTLSGLSFKANSLEQIVNDPTYFLVLKGDPTDGTKDSVGWSLGTFEEQDTLQTVTDRGNTTTQSITIANLFADSAKFSGGVFIQGDLIVNGTQTTINSTILTVDDKNIVIADGATNAAAADGAGITVDGANATITYSASTDTWQFNKGINAIELSSFDSVIADTLDVEDLFISGKTVYDSIGDQELVKTLGSLIVRSDVFELTNASGSNSFAVFQQDNIQITEITTFSDSTTVAGKAFLTDVPARDDNVKLLFRRQSDGLVMEGDIQTESLGLIDQLKTEDTDSDATHYLVFTYANAGTGGFDSAYIDVSDLTYNPSTNTLVLENVVANGLSDLDSTVVEGDLQLRPNPSVAGSGRLLDSEGRSFVIYDSSGFLLWGNNGSTAGNLPVVTGSTLNDLFDVTITSVDDGQYIRYDAGTGQWVNVTVAPGASGVTSLIDLDDVAGDGTSGQVLTTDGAGNFSFQTVSSGGASAINDLSDVVITSPAPGQVLKYNGSIWVNDTDLTSSGGTGGLSSRTSPSVIVPSLASNAQSNANIVNGFPTYALLKIATSHASWVRIYTDDAARTADASRLITDDPAPDAGVVAEIVTTGSEVIRMSPGVIGWNENGDAVIPIRVQNLSGGTASITVTLTAVELEA
jgi:hypothetical protein